MVNCKHLINETIFAIFVQLNWFDSLFKIRKMQAIITPIQWLFTMKFSNIFLQIMFQPKNSLFCLSYPTKNDKKKNEKPIYFILTI